MDCVTKLEKHVCDVIDNIEALYISAMEDESMKPSAYGRFYTDIYLPMLEQLSDIVYNLAAAENKLNS